MSLDITLYLRDPISGTAVDVFDANITHNLTGMARVCDLYLPLWCPEKLPIKIARDLIPCLVRGIRLLEGEKKKECLELNPPNGWGSYGALLSVAENYLSACKSYPSAEISTCK